MKLQQRLSHSYTDGKEFTLARGKFKYIINFEDNVQINKKNGKAREIRYAPVDKVVLKLRDASPCAEGRGKQRTEPSWKSLDKPNMKPQIGSSGMVAVDRPQWDWAKSQSQECGKKCT